MKNVLLSVLISTLPITAWSTHSLGGEFRYTHLQDLTYTIEFHYWTCLEAPADRPEIIVRFGDGQLDTIPRTMMSDDPSASDCCGIRYSIYTTTHNYELPGVYTLAMEDRNRSSGIINIPNSNSQPFCTSATIFISNDIGPNNSAIFSADPYNWDFVWSTLVHDPQASDTDGDSLNFELVSPLGLGCTPAAGYTMPSTQPGGWTWLDATNGTYHWHLPNLIGQQVVAIRATERRLINGTWTVVGEVVRDMTICLASIPTGFEALNKEGTPILRPTLCDGTLWVTNPGSSMEWMSIVDATGREVRRFQALPGEQALQLTDLRPAMYLLRDQSGRSTRFILQ